MPLSHVQLAVPAAWRLVGIPWTTNRPFSLAHEAARLPRAYVRATDLGHADAGISTFYRDELHSALGVNVLGDVDPDVLARAVIERRFRDVLASRRDESLPYYYGYFTGHGRSRRPGLPIRLVGLLPRADRRIVGTLLDLRDYGHAFDHDWGRTASLLDAGFAVFTTERAEHGLSGRLDPRLPRERRFEILADHTCRALQLVGHYRRVDPRLQATPLCAIASGLAAAELVAAIRRQETDFGLAAVHFDNPLFRLGPQPAGPSGTLTRMVHGAFQTFPNAACEMESLYRKRTPPARTPHQSEASYRRTHRHFEAFGPRRHPVALLDLNETLETNRAWLASEEPRRLLPPTLTTFSHGDVEADPDETVRVYRGFARPDRDGLRETCAHSPFLDGGDLDLIEDVARFLRGHVPPSSRVAVGPSASPPPFLSRLPGERAASRFTSG